MKSKSSLSHISSSVLLMLTLIFACSDGALGTWWGLYKSKGDEKVLEKKIENYPLPFTVNPLLSPLAGLFISSPFEGCSIETGPYLIGGLGGGGAYLIVSVLHKKVEYKVDKLKDKKVVNASKDQKQIPSSSW